MTELIDNPPPLPEPTYGLFSVKKLYTADQYRAEEAAAFARGFAAGRNAGLEEANSNSRYWLCCGGIDPQVHRRGCFEAQRGFPEHCRFGTRQEHSDFQKDKQ